MPCSRRSWWPARPPRCSRWGSSGCGRGGRRSGRCSSAGRRCARWRRGRPPRSWRIHGGGVARGAVGGAGGQFVVFSTSADGDPLNASVPGTYDDPLIVHSPDPALAPAPLTVGGRPTLAAAPWSTVPAAVLERTVFWHLMTG